RPLAGARRTPSSSRPRRLRPLARRKPGSPRARVDPRRDGSRTARKTGRRPAKERRTRGRKEQSRRSCPRPWSYLVGAIDQIDALRIARGPASQFAVGALDGEAQVALEEPVPEQAGAAVV